jgi:hypothetical protein
VRRLRLCGNCFLRADRRILQGVGSAAGAGAVAVAVGVAER